MKLTICSTLAAVAMTVSAPLFAADASATAQVHVGGTKAPATQPADAAKPTDAAKPADAAKPTDAVAPVPAPAEAANDDPKAEPVKDDSKKPASTPGAGAKEIGSEIKTGAKKVGHKVADTAKKVGHGVSNAVGGLIGSAPSDDASADVKVEAGAEKK
jgi:hypothetical protein